MSEAVPISISILEKDYKIACPTGEQSSLLASAEYLDGKMREVREGDNNISSERVAVMTALNIAHELLSSNEQQNNLNLTLPSRLKTLESKITRAIENARQLEFPGSR